MCGIFGLHSLKKISDEDKKNCKRSLKFLKDRGPDEQNIKTFNNVILCHSRLSIIDLNNGAQPMEDFESRYTIIFNGEITNFKFLKLKLIKEYGVKFITDSDTEVLLYMYKVYKEKCLGYLEGMFAFAVYDKFKNEIFLARDPLGIKPLYYFKNKEKKFFFSSELRTFYKIGIKKFFLNEKKIDEFIIHGNIVGKETLHKDIFQLEAGCFAKISKKSFLVKKYWYPSQNLPYESKFTIAKNKLEKILINIFKEWSIADVQVGCLTSGGLDSGLLSKFLKKFVGKVKFFTSYSNEKGQDERKISLKITRSRKNHKFIKISDKNMAINFKKIISYTCEPIHNLNSITFYFLCKFIKEKFKIKVLLTGEGSDECFAGYKRHYDLAKKIKLNLITRKDLLMSLNYLTVNRFKKFNIKNKFSYKLSNERLKEGKEIKSSDFLNKVLEIDQKTFLPPYLNRMDMIGGMFGMEIRPPYLDKRVVEYSHKIPGKFKCTMIKNFLWRKYIMRKIAEKFLPKNLVWNKKSYQFSAPAAVSLKKDSFRKLFRSTINKNCYLGKYYNIAGILKMFGEHGEIRESKNDHSNTLIRILSLELMIKNLKNV